MPAWKEPLIRVKKQDTHWVLRGENAYGLLLKNGYVEIATKQAGGLMWILMGRPNSGLKQSLRVRL